MHLNHWHGKYVKPNNRATLIMLQQFGTDCLRDIARKCGNTTDFSHALAKADELDSLI